MSLIGVLRTGVSGMNAQSNRISTVSENVQNASTTGYKRTSTEFSSLLLDAGGSGNYNSGAVETVVRRAISEQGNVAFTTSPTDVAIQGDGFFMVQDSASGQYLTRAGNFVVDGSNGNLVNAGGFTLLGYGLLPSGEPDTSKGLVPIHVPSKSLEARPSTQGTLSGNLPYATAVHSGAPGTAAGSYDKKTSIVTYDNVGQAVTLDVYMTKTAADTWSISVYDTQAPPVQIGSTATVAFDANGKAVSGTNPITIPASATSPEISIDLKSLTQLAGDYDVKGAADGAAPSAGTGIAFGTDGTVYTTYADGKRSPTYRVPLADVRSPDHLIPKAGNVFEATNESGKVEMGFAGIGGRGSVKSGALEQSNVDVSSELTTMIESQSVYTANSKVFMTGNEMLDTLMNLKR